LWNFATNYPRKVETADDADPADKTDLLIREMRETGPIGPRICGSNKEFFWFGRAGQNKENT
jgi:hypothetical protein